MEYLRDRREQAAQYVKQHAVEFTLAGLLLTNLGALFSLSRPEVRDAMEKQAQRSCLIKGIENEDVCNKYVQQQADYARFFLYRGSGW